MIPTSLAMDSSDRMLYSFMNKKKSVYRFMAYRHSIFFHAFTRLYKQLLPPGVFIPGDVEEYEKIRTASLSALECQLTGFYIKLLRVFPKKGKPSARCEKATSIKVRSELDSFKNRISIELTQLRAAFHVILGSVYLRFYEDTEVEEKLAGEWSLEEARRDALEIMKQSVDSLVEQFNLMCAIQKDRSLQGLPFYRVRIILKQQRQRKKDKHTQKSIKDEPTECTSDTQQQPLEDRHQRRKFKIPKVTSKSAELPEETKHTLPSSDCTLLNEIAQSSIVAPETEAVPSESKSVVQFVPPTSGPLKIGEKCRVLSLLCLEEECFRAFANTNELGRHLKVYHKLSFYRCRYFKCKQTFKNKEQLTKHITGEHSGVKMWRCPLCSVYVNWKEGLEGHRHLDTHVYLNHFKGIFKCALCEYVDCNRARLLTHYTEVHAQQTV